MVDLGAIRYALRLSLAIVGVAVGLGGPLSALAEDRIQFPSLDGSTSLSGFLYRPVGDVPAAAIVMMHGCSGLASSTRPFALYRDWKDLFVSEGYVVLMVDSAAARGFGQTCTPRGSKGNACGSSAPPMPMRP